MPMPAIPTLLLVPGDDLHDPEALFAIATAYAHAGHIVSAHGLERDQIAFTFPAIVCSSFALELFLKFFLMVDLIERGETTQKIKFDHTIPGLWAKITPDHKAIIAGMFRNTTGEPLTTGQETRLRIFEEALGFLGTQPFVQWRYAHELKGPQLMAHGAISLVVDAFGYAAAYVFNRMQRSPTTASSKL